MEGIWVKKNHISVGVFCVDPRPPTIHQQELDSRVVDFRLYHSFKILKFDT